MIEGVDYVVCPACGSHLLVGEELQAECLWADRNYGEKVQRAYDFTCDNDECGHEFVARVRSR